MGVARPRPSERAGSTVYPGPTSGPPMPFPLSEWIDGHDDCRHNLAKSGMIDSIPTPFPSSAEIRKADPTALRERLADDLGVDPRRVFLTTGGSQANALALLYLGRTQSGRTGRCRVCYPEYPPLFDTARAAGFRLTDSMGPADVAVVSQPRNPEGDLWERSRLLDWASGARALVVDETFREFAGTRSVTATDRPGLWATGSFTKFYAADALRVGFVAVPEEAVDGFGAFHGLVTNLLPPFSVAGAQRALRQRSSIRRAVRRIVEKNVRTLERSLPEISRPQGPVAFDRLGRSDSGDALARRALRHSVLVCSGSFFGDPSGVRLCLTRRSFDSDLRAYLAVRDRTPKRPRAGR